MSLFERLGGRSPLEGAPKPHLPHLPVPDWRLVLAALAVLLYAGWVAYTGATDGIDRGVGVLVSWPALLLLTALVLAPFVAVWVLARRMLREDSEAEEAVEAEAGTEGTTDDEDADDEEEDEDGAEDEDEDEEEDEDGDEDGEDEEEEGGDAEPAVEAR